MEKIVLKLLGKYLDVFCLRKDDESHKLKIEARKGYAELLDLSLDGFAIQEALVIPPHLRVESARCRALRVQLPTGMPTGKRLVREPVCVTLEGITADLYEPALVRKSKSNGHAADSGDTSGGGDDDEYEPLEALPTPLRDSGLFNMKSSSGPSGMANKIRDTMILKVTDVTLRCRFRSIDVPKSASAGGDGGAVTFSTWEKPELSLSLHDVLVESVGEDFTAVDDIKQCRKNEERGLELHTFKKVSVRSVSAVVHGPGGLEIPLIDSIPVAMRVTWRWYGSATPKDSPVPEGGFIGGLIEQSFDKFELTFTQSTWFVFLSFGLCIQRCFRRKVMAEPAKKGVDARAAAKKADQDAAILLGNVAPPLQLRYSFRMRRWTMAVVEDARDGPARPRGLEVSGTDVEMEMGTGAPVDQSQRKKIRSEQQVFQSFFSLAVPSVVLSQSAPRPGADPLLVSQSSNFQHSDLLNIRATWLTEAGVPGAHKDSADTAQKLREMEISGMLCGLQVQADLDSWLGVGKFLKLPPLPTADEEDTEDAAAAGAATEKLRIKMQRKVEERLSAVQDWNDIKVMLTCNDVAVVIPPVRVAPASAAEASLRVELGSLMLVSHPEWTRLPLDDPALLDRPALLSDRVAPLDREAAEAYVAAEKERQERMSTSSSSSSRSHRRSRSAAGTEHRSSSSRNTSPSSRRSRESRGKSPGSSSHRRSRSGAGTERRRSVQVDGSLPRSQSSADLSSREQDSKPKRLAKAAPKLPPKKNAGNGSLAPALPAKSASVPPSLPPKLSAVKEDVEEKIKVARQAVDDAKRVLKAARSAGSVYRAECILTRVSVFLIPAPGAVPEDVLTCDTATTYYRYEYGALTTDGGSDAALGSLTQVGAHQGRLRIEVKAQHLQLLHDHLLAQRQVLRDAGLLPQESAAEFSANLQKTAKLRVQERVKAVSTDQVVSGATQVGHTLADGLARLSNKVGEGAGAGESGDDEDMESHRYEFRVRADAGSFMLPLNYYAALAGDPLPSIELSNFDGVFVYDGPVEQHVSARLDDLRADGLAPSHGVVVRRTPGETDAVASLFYSRGGPHGTEFAVLLHALQTLVSRRAERGPSLSPPRADGEADGDGDGQPQWLKEIASGDWQKFVDKAVALIDSKRGQALASLEKLQAVHKEVADKIRDGVTGEDVDGARDDAEKVVGHALREMLRLRWAARTSNCEVIILDEQTKPAEDGSLAVSGRAGFVQQRKKERPVDPESLPVVKALREQLVAAKREAEEAQERYIKAKLDLSAAQMQLADSERVSFTGH